MPDRDGIATLLRGLTEHNCPDLGELRLWLQAAALEGIAPVIASQWSQALEQTDPRWPLLQEVLRAAVAQDLGCQAAERKILDTLRTAGISPIVLKGAALARWLFPDSYMRPRADIDLLFEDFASVQAAETVLKPAGFRWDGTLTNGPCFERVLVGRVAGREHQLDAHWRLCNHPTFAESFRYRELVDSAQRIATLDGAMVLDPIHALVHACLHRVGNVLAGAGDRLIWIYDIHLLANRLSSAQWSTLVFVASEKGVAGPCVDALAAATRLMGTKIPAAVCADLAEAARAEDFSMRLAPFRWYFELQILRRMPWWQWPRQLIGKLLPPSSYMMQRYRLTRRRQLPIAYIRRVLGDTCRLFQRDSQANRNPRTN